MYIISLNARIISFPVISTDEENSVDATADESVNIVSTGSSSFSQNSPLYDSFKILCSQCLQNESIQSAMISSTRENLRTFLNKSFDGQLILIHNENFNTLSDDMVGSLVKLLIDRELEIIFFREKVSAQNPLKNLECVCYRMSFMRLTKNIEIEL